MKYDINKLSLEEKIGQLFMFGFDATDINDHALKLIKDYKVGNVILFARNVKTPEQVFKLNQNLQKLAYKEIGVPLLISIDQEGGMVSRITNGATFFPGAMTIAATNDVNNAYLSGKYMGLELINLGVNMNYAPVLDVNNNPKNPVIGVRSFSDQPNMVAEYGTAFMEGLQENVIATAKHFPGHGDTTIDSHLALPRVSYGMDRLNEVELVPFRKAIQNGIQAIMSSHIDFPALTEYGLPTTLSKKCMTDFLRGELGFEGLIVTDGMQMKAIQDNYTTVKASLMAIEAGANMVCICHSEELQMKAVEYVKEAVLANRVSIDIINERVARVLKFKENLKDIDLSKSYQSVKDIVENEKTKDFSYQVVRNALTLVKGKPLELKDKALFIGALPIATSIADESDGEHSIIKKIKQELPSLETMTLPIQPTKEEIESIIKQAKKHAQVILCTYNANIFQEQIELINRLTELNIELHVISMRNPYDLHYAKNVENYVCLYEYTPNSLRVLLEYLKKELIPSGIIPIAYE
jgi:beta-N-acetylhexosaminidase